MVEIAKENRVEIAILLDMSASCGSQVISEGCRLVQNRKFQKGPGVCAALLQRSGFKVISQRDYRTLGYLRKKLNPSFNAETSEVDHHETEWYKGYFGLN